VPVTYISPASRPLTLREAFDAHNASGSRVISKHDNYFALYDRVLAPYRDRPVTLIEIGVQHGGSMQMWKRYLAPGSTVVGLDIYPECRQFEEDGVRIMIGDQSDRAFLQRVVAEAGPADVIIDDGSHIPSHQIASFEMLFAQALKPGGIYIVEDCHTSYWPRYGGGEGRRGTFIEYAKRAVDDLNWWHIEGRGRPKRWLTDWLEAVEFVSSVVVFRKNAMQAPATVQAGEVRGLDLNAPFSGGRLGNAMVRLKRNAFLQAQVRRHPALWRMMKRFMR
jgi:hypothetical protein